MNQERPIESGPPAADSSAGLSAGPTPNSETRPWIRWWIWGVLVFFIYEIAHDLYTEGMDFEVVVEAITVAAMLSMLHGEWQRNRRLNVDLGVAKADTERAQAGVQRLSGEFSAYVLGAFGQWGLSRSEQEIAWLLVKGFPFAEIATLRGVQERTVRQQATAIYAKSGCKNRNELVAHFIEDLLVGDALGVGSKTG